MSRVRRLEIVRREDPQLSLVRRCALLGISRSSMYYQPAQAKAEDLEMIALMDRQYLKALFYGSRRMTAWLRVQGYQINRRRVRRLLWLMGVESIYQRPNTSRPSPEHRVYPLGMVGRVAPSLAFVTAQDRRKVQAVHHVGDKVAQVVRG